MKTCNLHNHDVDRCTAFSKHQFYTWHGGTSWKGDWLFSEAWDKMRTALRFHGDKSKNSGLEHKFRFQGTDTHTHTHLCKSEQSNSPKLSTKVGLTCGYRRHCVGEIGAWKSGRTEETDGQRRGCKEECRCPLDVHILMSMWNVAFHRSRGCLLFAFLAT